MKRMLLSAALICAAAVMAAENLLPALQINTQTGFPKHWYPSAGAPVEIVRGEQGEILFRNTMASDGKKVYWMLNPLKVKAEKFYRIKVKARAEKPLSASLIAETNKPWQTIAKKYDLTTEWKEYTLEFSFKPFEKAPYFLFRLNTPGKAEFVPLFLEEYEKPLVTNGTFAELNSKGIPVNWNVTPGLKAERVTLADGKYGIKLSGSGKNPHIIQHNIPVKAGDEYQLSVKFQGKPGMVARIVVECNNPWKTCGKRIKCDGSLQESTQKVTFEKLGRQPYLLLGIVGDGEVVFSDLQLTLKKKRVICDFETGNANWQLINSEIVSAGGAYGKVLQLNGTKSKASARLAGFRLQGGKNYTLSYDVQGGNDRNFTDSQNATWFRIALQADGKILPGTEYFQDSFNSWQHKSVTFRAEKECTAELVCELRDPGTVRFDNIRIEEGGIVEKPLTLLLHNPAGFRDTLNLQDSNTLSGHVAVLRRDVKTYTVRFGKEEKTLPVDNPFSFEVREPGTYQLSVTIPGEKNVTRTIRAVRKKTPVISFREDNVMLLDGVPFFPIAVWSVRGGVPFAEKMRRLAKNHINTASCGNAEEVNAAAEAGLFTIVRGPEKLPVFPNNAQYQSWEKFYRGELQDICRNSSVIGFFISDEPSWRGVSAAEIQKSYQFLRGIIPQYPIWLNEAPRGTVAKIRPFSEAADIYGIDIYPVPAPNSHSGLDDKMMTSVGKYTDICRTVVHDSKPVWMTLQAFSWGAMTHKNPRVYPTHEENRFMAYDAIVHGATGLAYWGMNWGEENWEFIDLLGKTLKEIKELSPVLTARTVSPCTLKFSAPEIRVLQKDLRGVNYFIAVNESGKEITVPLEDSKKYKVLFEDRTAGASDTFAPWGVHIYTDGPGLPPPYQFRKLSRTAPAQARSIKEIPGVNWIWYPGTNNQPGSKAIFLREFTLSELPVKAELFAAADDFLKAFVNDTPVIEHFHNRGHSVFSVADVTKLLKKGVNRLVIKAMDGGQAPCGMAYALKITEPNGKETLLVSDQETLVTNAVTKHLSPESMKPSQLLFPLGKGPWGAGLQILPVQKECVNQMGFPF